jgi:hypothetical protein
MTLLPRQTLSWQPKRSSKNFERFMPDAPETIALRVTVIGGQRYDDDYHRGLARHGRWPAKNPTGRQYWDRMRE